MDTLQCAIVLAKLDRFDWEVEQRKSLGARYNGLLAAKLPVVTQRSDRTSVFAQYTVFVEERQRVQELLKNVGIPTAVHYPLPLNQQPAYQSICRGEATPVSDEISKKVMSLPMSPDLSLIDLQDVVKSLLQAVS
jgi:UDP-2-acetamido-2-deoxy-ribo-hexuluronate aminotransferase